MKTRIHFAVLNLSKMVLNYRKNLVKSCTINFIMQTAVMLIVHWPMPAAGYMLGWNTAILGESPISAFSIELSSGPFALS